MNIRALALLFVAPFFLGCIQMRVYKPVPENIPPVTRVITSNQTVVSVSLPNQNQDKQVVKPTEVKPTSSGVTTVKKEAPIPAPVKALPTTPQEVRGVVVSCPNTLSRLVIEKKELGSVRQIEYLNPGEEKRFLLSSRNTKDGMVLIAAGYTKESCGDVLLGVISKNFNPRGIERWAPQKADFHK